MLNTNYVIIAVVIFALVGGVVFWSRYHSSAPDLDGIQAELDAANKNMNNQLRY